MNATSQAGSNIRVCNVMNKKVPASDILRAQNFDDLGMSQGG